MSKSVCFLLVTFFMFSLTGCWDYTPLDKNFVVVGIGIDISESNSSHIKVTAFGPSFSDETREQYVRITSTGDSISDALKNAQDRIHKILSMSHVRIILISDKIAVKGINQHIGLFFRNAQISSETMVAVCKGRAEDYFSMKLIPFANVPVYMVDLIKTSETKAKDNTFTFREMINRLSSPSKGVVLPYISMDEENKQMLYERLCLFMEDRMIEVLKPEETVSYLLLRNILKRGQITIGSVNPDDSQAEAVTLRIFPKKRKVDTKLDASGIQVSLHYRIDDEVVELEPINSIIETEEHLKKYKKLASEKLKKDMTNLLKKIQNIEKLDGLGYGEYVRVKYPKYFSSINWPEEFKNVKFNLTVEFTAERLGIVK